VTLVILGWVLGPVGRNNVAFPLSLEFIFGMTIGVAYCEGARVAKSLGAVAIIFGFLAIGFSQTLGLISDSDEPMRVLVWGVPAAFVVAGATLTQWVWRPLMNRPAMLLGDASYALYLFHQPLIFIFALSGYGRSSWPIVIATCIIASISIHFLIERPIVGWFRSKSSAYARAQRRHLVHQGKRPDPPDYGVSFADAQAVQIRLAQTATLW